MSDHIKTIGEFVGTYIILRGIFARWLSELIQKYLLAPFFKLLKNKLIKSERDLAYFLHSYNECITKQKTGDK
jgi:hypothetical protein